MNDTALAHLLDTTRPTNTYADNGTYLEWGTTDADGHLELELGNADGEAVLAALPDDALEALVHGLAAELAARRRRNG